MVQSRRNKALIAALEQIQQGKGSADDYMNAASRIDEEDKAHGEALTKALGVPMSTRVDGEGSFYGFLPGGPHGDLNVYVYPPKHLWNGDVVPQVPELNDTDWQVMAAGYPYAAAAKIEDLPALKAENVPDPEKANDA